MVMKFTNSWRVLNRINDLLKKAEMVSPISKASALGASDRHGYVFHLRPGWPFLAEPLAIQR
ncbi:hypothetical protein HA45_06790 [Pantoea rodasii]|nr:hypothetical protein HA45_06790 [Pantoea rodasii]